MVAELYIRDVVRNCAEPMCFSQDHVRRHKEELGLRVHELAYEPGAGDAVHLSGIPAQVNFADAVCEIRRLARLPSAVVPLRSAPLRL